MTTHRSPADDVRLLELRIERRRQQLLRDWEDARTYVAQKNRWTPLAAVFGVAALGFGLSRTAETLSSPLRARTGPKRRALSAFVATLASGVRFLLSPTGRALWTSVRQGRGQPRRGRETF